jgi:hypothetical protein
MARLLIIRSNKVWDSKPLLQKQGILFIVNVMNEVRGFWNKFDINDGYSSNYSAV